MPTSSNIIGWIITIIISIIGWVLVLRANGTAKREAALIAKETAAVEIAKVTEALKSLPCAKNPEYEHQQGELFEKVKNMERLLNLLVGEKFGINKSREGQHGS